MEGMGEPTRKCLEGGDPKEYPPEVWDKIFGYLEDEALQNAVNVCNGWRKVIADLVGLQLVTLSSQLLMEGPRGEVRRYYGLDIIRQIGVKKIAIEPGYEGLLTHPPAPIPALSVKRMLKELSIESLVHPDLFVSLVTSSVCLASLELAIPVLRHIRPDDLRGLQLPNLKRLKLHSTPHFQLEDELGGIGNMEEFLAGNTFPGLKQMECCYPTESAMEVRSTASLIRFVLRHRWLDELIVESHITSGEAEQPRTDDQLMGVMRRGDGIPLKTLKLHVHSRRTGAIRPSPQLELWEQFVQMVVGLEVLELYVNPLTAELLQNVCIRNGATLVEVEVGRMQFNCDLGQFAPMTLLRSLVIREAESFSNASRLPGTIVKMHLKGFIPGRDLRSILLELPALIYLFMDLSSSSPTVNYERMDPVNIQDLIHARRIHRVELTGHMMWSLPVNFSVGNEDPVNPEDIFVDPFSRDLNLRLNPAGYYVNLED